MHQIRYVAVVGTFSKLATVFSNARNQLLVCAVSLNMTPLRWQPNVAWRLSTRKTQAGGIYLRPLAVVLSDSLSMRRGADLTTHTPDRMIPSGRP